MATPSTNGKQALYDYLKVSVLTLELAPGSDLDEVALAGQFGISRTPLREVFRQLASEGVLDARAGRGARVSEMSQSSLRDFFQAAPMIYSAILRLAAQHASQGQIEALQSAQDAFKLALQDGDAAQRALANNRFHEITGDMAGNTYLLPSFHRLLIDHARISMTFYDPHEDAGAQARAKASAQHDAIIDAIIRRDAPAAGELAQAHWALSRDQIERFIMPPALHATLGQAPHSPQAAETL